MTRLRDLDLLHGQREEEYCAEEKKKCDLRFIGSLLFHEYTYMFTPSQNGNLKKNRAHWKINSLKTKEKCIKRCSNYVGLFKIYTYLSILGRLHILKHRKIFFYLDLSYHFLVLVPLIFRSIVSNEERKN